MDQAMSRIVSNSPPVTSYQLCDPTAVTEAAFEADVLRVLQYLYPQWQTFVFRPDVSHMGAVWRPDLAIVDRNLEYWFIVEVEIATHHLEKHILPQVTAFLHGDYAESAAVLLASAIGISSQRASTLLAYVPREIVVVSNRMDEVWDEKLAALGSQHLVISEFRNTLSGKTLHKIDGEIIPSQKSIGFGIVRATDRAIITQAGSYWRCGAYQISGPQGIATWQCTVIGKNAWLLKQRGLIEFPDGRFVQFLIGGGEQIIVREPYPVRR